MFEARTRKRSAVSALSFLFVLAVCAAFAAHERLHELEHHQAGDASQSELTGHDHPVRAVASPEVAVELVVLGTVEPDAEPTLLPAHAARALRLRPGPVCDDDVGLHDALSIYLI